MIYWIIGIYIIGFIACTGLVFLTGGENHTRGNEWYWVWFNLAIWPIWVLLFGLAALSNYFKNNA